ncbi:hypothetical protein ACP4OV_023013 [Aristida adscensionis]
MDEEDLTVSESDSEEEEDEEIMMLIIPALYVASTKTKTPCHTSKLTGAEYISELLKGHPIRCYNNLRMEPHIFQALSDYLTMFMYMLARNACFRALCDRFQHSGETIHRHIGACFDAISSLAFDFVKPPSMETHWKISSNPHFGPYFENCLGAIDGTHIPVTVHGSKAPPYRNRKGTLSQNVMLACDFDLNFVYVSTGWEGSASDARVLNSAIKFGFQVPRGKYYLVDGGNANTPSFLAPYRGAQYHVKGQGQNNCRPRDYKELFNLRHARLRNHIERAIGILKMRFPIFKVATYYPIETQVKIPAAAVVLHNIIRSHKGDEEWLGSQKTMINPRKFVAVPDSDDRYRDDVAPLSSQRNEGNTIRDEIAKRMWADYERSRRRRGRRSTAR